MAPLSLKGDLAGPARVFALLASCLSAAVALPQERLDLAAGSGQSQATAHAAGDGLARARLIARGEDLFINETFNGNGRTCATCHPVENNFTLDPGFIARLKRNDPLFVAERNPALADLENPRLLRAFGLIRENVDGFEKPAVLRAVPHILSLSTSVASSFSGPQTGWSGDGAPGDRSLRSFATGAVEQHFTKTMGRVPGVDFRLPTEAELDALLAFQQSLGRQSDPVLPLPLQGTVPRRGQDIFLDDTLGKCNLCHVNAGANATFGGGNLGNIRVDIGVQALLDPPAGLTGEFVPPDGGFGQDAIPMQPGFGDGTFNIPPLVEAADTPPFFHNNAIATLEGAVAFYNSDAFNNSRGARQIGGGIHLDTTQVEAVAAFLRVINALDNIDSAIRLQRSALKSRDEARRARFVARSAGEAEDAIEVLAGARLHPDAVTLLNKARSSVTGCEPCSNKTIRKAIRRERTARGRIAAPTGL